MIDFVAWQQVFLLVTLLPFRRATRISSKRPRRASSKRSSGRPPWSSRWKVLTDHLQHLTLRCPQDARDLVSGIEHAVNHVLRHYATDRVAETDAIPTSPTRREKRQATALARSVIRRLSPVEQHRLLSALGALGHTALVEAITGRRRGV